MVPNIVEIDTTAAKELDEPELLGEIIMKETNDDELGNNTDEDELKQRVNKALTSLLQDSKLFSSSSSSSSSSSQEESRTTLSCPELKWLDVDVGNKIGQGGFNSVHEVRLPGGGDNTVYAIKYLKPQLYQPDQTKRLHQGAADLVVEGRLLSVLDHPNLVEIKAVSAPSEDRPFLVISKLEQTLLKRMAIWKKKDRDLPNRYRKESQLQQHRRHNLNGRLQVAMDIARVLQYLYKKSVVYRDLKPENIGFDSNGTVKLFDLGLAKEMKNPQQNGKYRMTGQTGSWIYMAPEVAKHWAYDGMVDVYSFGILLWEICALEEPFAGLTDQQHMQQVVSGDLRPPIDKSWPTELQWLMKKCWSYFSSHRPTWEVVIETLQEVMDDTDFEEAEDSVRGFASLRAMSWRSKNSGEVSKPNSGRFVQAAPRVNPTPRSPNGTARGRRLRTRSDGARVLFGKKK